MIRTSTSTLGARSRGGPRMAYLRFETRRRFRDRRFLVLAAGFPILLYLVYTAIFSKAGQVPDVGGIPWDAYFMVSMATYGAMGAAMTWAVTIAVERRSGWVRLLRTTPLPPSGYVLVKVAVTLLTVLPALVLICLAARFINGVELGLATWLELVPVLVLGSIPFAALAVALGYFLRPENAQPVTMLLYFVMAILGGLFAPISALPDPLATIGRMLPSYRLASLGWQVLAGVPLDLSDVAVLAAWSAIFGGAALLRYRTDEQGPTA